MKRVFLLFTLSLLPRKDNYVTLLHKIMTLLNTLLLLNNTKQCLNDKTNVYTVSLTHKYLYRTSIVQLKVDLYPTWFL